MQKSTRIIVILGAIITILGTLTLVMPDSRNKPVPAITPTQTPVPIPEKNLTIIDPVLNQQVGYIITIKGQARVFENQFQWRIRDFKGNLLASGASTSDSPDAGIFGNYTITTAYRLPSSETGFVEVYDSSAKDGSEQDNVIIPVRFPAGETGSVKVFFPKAKESADDCLTVFPVTRYIPKTQALATAALEQLIAGPTTAEERLGFTTNFKPGVKVNKLTIEKGIARVDFNSRLMDGVGGSCYVGLLGSQIETTLLQFPSVNQVEITMDGQPEPLQP